jgi:phage head maturation protease
MPNQYISATLKKEDGRITFVASDETLDRGGEVIPIDSWDLSNFKKNPVLLVNHDYKVENIVGLAKRVRVESGQLLFDPEFHGITQLSREVKDMVEQGILNTVSVGFMPHGPKKDGDKASNELFEISFVPVPANPSAERLRAVMAKAIDETGQAEVKAWVEKQRENTEVQTIICSKEKFASMEEAATWCKSHDFKADKADETETSYRFRQMEPGSCQQDSFRTIDMMDGVEAVICRPKKAAEVPIATEDELLKSLEAKGEDGVLVHPKLLNEIITARNSAAADLAKTRTEKDSLGNKGREPKEERGPSLSVVVRALQRINGETNAMLKELK